jgi:hypothetical protein
MLLSNEEISSVTKNHAFTAGECQQSETAEQQMLKAVWIIFTIYLLKEKLVYSTLSRMFHSDIYVDLFQHL